jgi:alanine dehydrogenase
MKILSKESVMRVGVPSEIKSDESRVAITPAGVDQFCTAGHTMLVQAGAGLDSGYTDEEYIKAGARIVEGAYVVFTESEMIMKVKEPLPEEYDYLRPDLIVFTYFHFAAARELTDAVIDSRVVAIAYETVMNHGGELPLLVPMSEVAGRMAVQEGAKYLEKRMGGRGILLAGVPGVPPANVMILGGGIVGKNAAIIAAGMGADVTIFDINLRQLRYLEDIMPPNVKTMMSNNYNIAAMLPLADLVIGAVLIPGAKAPNLITRDMLGYMKDRSVIVDVAIDQGGCIETSHPTTHNDPIYVVDNVVHYTVANMPGTVPRTSTIALTNATLPYALEIASHGWIAAARKDPAIRHGLNIVKGDVVHQKVAEAFDLPWKEQWS